MHAMRKSLYPVHTAALGEHGQTRARSALSCSTGRHHREAELAAHACNARPAGSCSGSTPAGPSRRARTASSGARTRRARPRRRRAAPAPAPARRPSLARRTGWTASVRGSADALRRTEPVAAPSVLAVSTPAASVTRERPNNARGGQSALRDHTGGPACSAGPACSSLSRLPSAHALPSRAVRSPATHGRPAHACCARSRLMCFKLCWP